MLSEAAAAAACPMPACLPSVLTISIHASLPAAASTWAKTFSGSWGPLLSGVQQARCAGISFPPSKTGEHWHRAGGLAPGACSTLAPRAPSAKVLGLPLVLGACPSLSLSHFAMALQVFPGIPSQVKSLLLNSGVRICFTEKSS